MSASSFFSLEGLKKIPDSLQKLPDSLKKSWATWSESKDKGTWERLKLSFEAFKNEWFGLEEQKAQVSAETQQEISKVAQEELGGFSESLVAPEVNAPEEDKQRYTFFASALAATEQEMNGTDEPEKVQNALATLKVRADGKSDALLTMDHAVSLGGAACLFLSKLKERFSSAADKDECKKFLEYAFTASSKFPVKNILKKSVLRGVLPLDLGTVQTLLGKFGLGLTTPFELASVYDMGKSLKSGPEQDMQRVVEVMKKHFLPNTPPESVQVVAKEIYTLLSTTWDEIPTESLAVLIVHIHASDFEYLRSKLT